jgi:hypothetical protein
MKSAFCLSFLFLPTLACAGDLLLYVPAPRVAIVRTYVAAPLAVEVRDAHRATPNRITSVDFGGDRVSFAAPAFAGPIRRVDYGPGRTDVYYHGGKRVQIRQRTGRMVVDYDD